LQERVFPRLQAFCLERGARFQAIDLRWGVSAEAGLDQQTINICLDEVTRCQEISPRPNFIVLLGDRYGWQPPPPQIPKDRFEDILERTTGPEAKTLLEQWYVFDENAVPPERYLKPRDGRSRDDGVWEPIERELRAILERAVAEMPLEKSERRTYETSATEQEIQRGALSSLPDHVFCYFRSIDFSGELPDDERAADYLNVDPDGALDQTAGRRLESLKKELRRLPERNVHHYEARWTGDRPDPITVDHLDRLCDDVYEDMLGVIGEEIERIERVDPIEREIGLHQRFGQDRAGFFTGRADVLTRIAEYLERPNGKPLVLFGAGGSGKSTVMARAAHEAARRFPGSVILRFIGVTPDSTSGRALIDGLARDISRRFDADESTIPSDYRELAQDLRRRMELASESRPLVIFLDALDQLSPADGARSLSWLPSDLPAGVRLVVSSLAGEALRPLDGRVAEEYRIALMPMPPEEAGELLDLWLQDADRTLQPEQRTAVLRQFAVAGLPLWLKLAFEEARRWKSQDAVVELPESIEEIIGDTLFGRLEDEANHGEVLVSRSLGYLGAAKNGLSEDEMIDLLSLGGREGAALKDFRRRAPKSPDVDRLPVIVWSRLYFDLEPYLTERAADGAVLMAFYHRQLSEAAGERYVDGTEGLTRHRELASYFDGQPIRLAGEHPNLRKLSELPYQQTMGELWDDVFRTLTDFEFLERKASDMGFVESADGRGGTTRTYTGIYQVREDYALALARMPGGSGAATTDGRRRIIVTAVDLGDGLVIRCPHCNEVHPFQPEWKGREIVCPGPACGGPLRVNPFVVDG
ncbi:MAG: AAA family ATPase, partial [Actinomycetota bacterium]